MDVTGGVLGGCCQVTIALPEPPSVLVTLSGQDGTSTYIEKK